MFYWSSLLLLSNVYEYTYSGPLALKLGSFNCPICDIQKTAPYVYGHINGNKFHQYQLQIPYN